MCQAYHNILYEFKSDIESLSIEFVEMVKHQEINLSPSPIRKSKSAKYKKGMPTIRCMCGLRILVVPDLKAMNRAIKNHITTHKQVDYSLDSDSLEEFLTEQILIAASEMELPNVS